VSDGRQKRRTYGITSAGIVDSIWGTGFATRWYKYTTSTGVLDEVLLGVASANRSFDDKLRITSTTFSGGNIVSKLPLSWDVNSRYVSNQGALDDFNRKLEYDDAGQIRSQFTDPIPAELGNFFCSDGTRHRYGSGWRDSGQAQCW
jgi:hypothetical protein